MVFLIRFSNDCVVPHQEIGSLLMLSYIWGMDFNIDKVESQYKELLLVIYLTL